MAHKLLRASQDKLEEQIRMRKEQVSVYWSTYLIHTKNYVFIFPEQTVNECRHDC